MDVAAMKDYAIGALGGLLLGGGVSLLLWW